MRCVLDQSSAHLISTQTRYHGNEICKSALRLLIISANVMMEEQFLWDTPVAHILFIQAASLLPTQEEMYG